MATRSDADACSHAGFTLIELMIVITIIFILIGMAAARYDQSVQRAQGSDAEAEFAGHAPSDRQLHAGQASSAAIARGSVNPQARYLREVPTDPMTHQKDWVPQFDSVVLSPDQTSTGMVDVHSNSPRVSPIESTPYNEW